MKRIKHLLLFVGTALFLAACGTGGNGGDNGGGQDGTLRFALNGVPSAAVEVLSGSDTVFDETVENGDSTTLAAGDYTVRAGAVSGFNAPAAQNVTVVAGQTVTATLNYTTQGSDNGDNGDNGTDPVTEAGVHVRVFPPEARDGATVSVLDVDGEVVESKSGSGEVHFELDAAQDLRVQVSSPGYSTWTSEYFDLAEDETEDFRVTLAVDDSVTGNIARDGITFSFGDVDGNAFDTNQEVNPAKDATLLVAQVEEQICVTVNVADEAGNPVANAPVSVGLANDFWDAAIAYPGGCENELSAATSSGLGQLYTDSDGNVTFSMQLLNAGPLVWQAILTGEREPVKVLVSSVGADDVARTNEFKLFGVNMTHLVLGHMEAADIGDEGDFSMDDLDLMAIAATRLGHDYGVLTNIWDDAGGDNGHAFWTGAYTKQPHVGPHPVPNLMFDEAVDPIFGGLNWMWYPGYVEYEIIDGFDVAEWVGEPSSTLTVSPAERPGTLAVLNPRADVAVEDLPIAATVRATYYFTFEYGDTLYEFALKDYTFTKTWVGGFLTVDKHVDQHVLTWYGHDTDDSVTLDAYDETLITDDAFTSTVHVTVTNDSNAPIYNVAIRDAVPAELGVLVDSISAGGTYDISNHAVTWNFNNTPDLQMIDVGESFTFTFDVYARQKPGYCWDGEDDENFVVQPNLPGDCYADPYRVTNGLQSYSVTASGFYDDDITTQQYVYAYSPEADESDIWVVRPLFNISKTLISQPVIAVGASAFFEIEVSQENRYAVGREYRDLYNLYPWEFDNADTTSGTGHSADTSAARNNPYAHNVEVDDWFDVGIDFTNGTNFSGVNGGIIQIPGALDNDFSYTPIESLPVGVIAESTVTFSANLPSFDADGDATPGANGTVNVEIDGEVADYPAWQNCAFLNARQLNQPAEAGEDTWYSENGSPWAQDEVEESVYDRPDTDFPALMDCDAVVVLPAPPTAFVTLTTNGEYWEDDEGDIYESDLWDGYGRGNEFIYALTAQNTGVADATNVVITVSLDNNRVLFSGNYAIYVGTPGSWTVEDSGTLTSSDESTFAFAPVTLQQNEYARVIIGAEANAVGTVNMDATLTYDGGPSWQPQPLSVQEETSVQSDSPVAP